MASKMRRDFRRMQTSDHNAPDIDFYPLRMTTDHRTEMYVKFAKVMLIFHGPFTEENKEAAALLASKFKYAGRLISDETFLRETGRLLTLENIDSFYMYLRDRAKKSCEEGYNLIIINQSMNNPLQMKYYFYLAQKMQYVVLTYPPLVKKNSFKEKAGTVADEFKFITKTVVNHENLVNHMFCGWFLHDVDSAELREEAGLYIQDCFNNIFEFKEMFSKICEPSEFMSYYNMVNKRQHVAFCIVKFLHSLMDTDAYFSNRSFKQFYGSMSKLYIVGFVLSPYMVAARVKLTHEQKKLWEINDFVDEQSEIHIFPSKILKDCEVDFPSEELTLIASKSNRTIITGETIENPTEAIHWNAKGRSCHIVLGKVKDAKPLNTDYDAIFAASRERMMVQKNPKEFEPYDLDRCLVRRIGKYWYIYMKETLIVNGLFATCCSSIDTASGERNMLKRPDDLKQSIKSKSESENFKRYQRQKSKVINSG